MSIKSSEIKGSLFAITSGMLYGLVGFFGVSLIETHLSISNMQFWRFLSAALVVLFTLILQSKMNKDNWAEIAKAFLAGLLFYGPSAMVYFIASDYIGTGISMVILFTFPVFVMLFNKFIYKIKIAKIYYIAVTLMIIGLLKLIDVSEFTLDMIGIGFGVLAAILYACYIVSSKKIKISPLMSTFAVALGCSISCLLFSISKHTFMVPSTLLQWEYILGFGVVSTAFPMLFLLQGLKNITAEKASILSILEPVFVVIFGIILLGETITFSQMMGMIIILAGALMTLFSKNLNEFANHKLLRYFVQSR